MLCQFGQKQEPKSSEALRSVACKRPRTGSLPAPCFGSLWLHLAIVLECQDFWFRFMRSRIDSRRVSGFGFRVGTHRHAERSVRRCHRRQVLFQILWNCR